MPCSSSRSAERLVGPHEDEVRRRRRAVVAGRDQRRRASARAPRSSRRRRRGAGRAAPRRRSRADGPAIGAGARRSVRSAAVVGVRERVPDAKRGEAERLRQRPDDDEVRELVDPRRARTAPPYSTYASSTTTIVPGSRARELDDRLRLDPASRSGCSGCRPSGDPRRPSAPTTVAAVQRRRDPVERVGRRRRSRRALPARGTPARTSRMRSSAPAPTTTFSGVEPDVGRGRLAELAVRPVRVLVQPRHALRERHLRDAREAAACSGRTSARAPARAPCRAATSSTPAAQAYGAKPSADRLRLRAGARSRRTAAA